MCWPMEKRVSEMTRSELRGTIQSGVLIANLAAFIFALLVLTFVRLIWMTQS